MARQGHSTSLSEGGNLNWRRGGLDIFGSLYYDLTQRYQHQIDKRLSLKMEKCGKCIATSGYSPKAKPKLPQR